MSPLRLNRGKLGMIECTFSAVPVAVVTLQMDEATLQNVTNNKVMYSIDKVMDSHAGEYICMAENSVGPSELVVINVIVQGVALVLMVNCVFMFGCLHDKIVYFTKHLRRLCFAFVH